MTKVIRFFGTCVLVASLFSIAVAGDVPTPPVAPPPSADCYIDCPETEASALPQPESGGDIVTATDVATWLVALIQ